MIKNGVHIQKNVDYFPPSGDNLQLFVFHLKPDNPAGESGEKSGRQEACAPEDGKPGPLLFLHFSTRLCGWLFP